MDSLNGKINLLFTCDIWKSRNSMRLVGVFTNIDKRDDAIKTMLNNEQIELRDHWEYQRGDTVRDLNDFYDYLYAVEVDSNEFADGSYIA